MYADPPQRARERHSLSNYSQGSRWLASSDQAKVSRDIDAGRTGLVAGISELYNLSTPYIVANTHAALTEDAQVIITYEKGAILANRQFLGNIGHKILHSNIIDHSLQFATSVSWADDTLRLCNAGQSQTGVTGLAPLSAVAGEANLRVPRKYEL
jgi:hypothetical protein